MAAVPLCGDVIIETFEPNPRVSVVEEHLQISNLWDLARKESFGKHSGVARPASGSMEWNGLE
jgi:hypothetical protein